MKRRRFVALIGSALAVTHSVLAQQSARKYPIGALWSVLSESGRRPYRAALNERLAAHGFVEGKNLSIDDRIGAFGLSWDRKAVEELITGKPDALFTLTSGWTEAAQAATSSVPIVFAWVADPVLEGIVKEYARPGGNASGVSNRFIEVAIKRLELLRDLLPGAKRVALAWPLLLRWTEAARPRLREASERLGFELREVQAGAQDWVPAIKGAIRDGAEAVLPFTVFSWLGLRVTGEQVVRFTIEQRLPTIFAESEMVEAGGLISYGTNLLEDVRRGADMLAKVLRGAKPADIPVDQASRFELAVNLKTAKTLGIKIPLSILLRADRVIE